MTPLMERLIHRLVEAEPPSCGCRHLPFGAAYGVAHGCEDCAGILIRALLEVAGPEITEAIRQRDDRYFNDENFNFPDWPSLRAALLGEAP